VRANYIRVIVIQAASLAALWLLQQAFL